MSLAEGVFWGSIAMLAYTYAGYPVLLVAWARLRPRPVRAAPITPPVEIVIAVHNGEAHIARKLRSCIEQDYPPDRLRVLVVSDGSTDGTCAAVEAFGDPRVRLLPIAERRGKAACVNDAVAASREAILVLTDVRQPMDPQAVARLVANLADESVGAVSGALIHRREGMSDYGEGIDAYWRYEQFLRAAESRVHSMVGVLGALYALRRECFRPVPPQTILDDMLVPMRTVMQGRRVIFEGRALVYDEPLNDAARERARKVRTLAGNFQLLLAHPSMLVPWRNPILLQFLSHKLFRLLGPLALLAALVANAVLAAGSAVYATLLALQVAGYGAAAAGACWPAARRRLPVKLAMAFVSLNGFVLLGLVEFVSNRSVHLWKNAPVPAHGRPPPASSDPRA